MSSDLHAVHPGFLLVASECVHFIYRDRGTNHIELEYFKEDLVEKRVDGSVDYVAKVSGRLRVLTKDIPCKSSST